MDQARRWNNAHGRKYAPVSETMLKRTLLASIALAPTLAMAQPSSQWDHNGSTMVLTDEGPNFAIYYQDIRPALIRTIPPGAPRFRGRIVNGNSVSGDAFAYTKFCFGKPFPYHVSGMIHDGIIDLYGPAAVVDPHSCTIVGLRANSDNAHVVFAELAPPPPPASQPAPPPVIQAPPAQTPPIVVPPVVVPPVVIQAPAPVIVSAPAPVIVSPNTTTTTVTAPQEPPIVIAPAPRLANSCDAPPSGNSDDGIRKAFIALNVSLEDAVLGRSNLIAEHKAAAAIQAAGMDFCKVRAMQDEELARQKASETPEEQARIVAYAHEVIAPSNKMPLK